jgi:hypothetical protein
VRGNGALGRRLEQALLLQAVLQPHEAFVQRPEARLAHRLDGELEAPARFVQRGEGAHFHLGAVAQLPVEPGKAAAEHDAVHLRPAVFQREIAMAGRRARQVGQLAPYPHEREAALERVAHAAQQLGNRDNARGGRYRLSWKVVLHRSQRRLRAYTNPHEQRRGARDAPILARKAILSRNGLIALEKALLVF